MPSLSNKPKRTDCCDKELAEEREVRRNAGLSFSGQAAAYPISVIGMTLFWFIKFCTLMRAAISCAMATSAWAADDSG